MKPETPKLYTMSPQKPVRPIIAPDVIVEQVSANAYWKSQNARNATPVEPYVAGAFCRKKYSVPKNGVPEPNMNAKPQAEQEPAETGVDDAFHQHVDGLARTTETRLQHGEACLHAEHQERCHERPHRVDRVDDVVAAQGWSIRGIHAM